MTGLKPDYDKVVDEFKKKRSGRVKRQVANVLRLIDLGDPAQRILEVGVATGKFTSIISKRQKVYALDLSLENLMRARKTVGEFGNQQQACYMNADCTAMPFKESSFDKVLAIDIAEHLDDRHFALFCQQAFRALVPKGRFYIYTPNATHPFQLLLPFRPALRAEHIGVRSRGEIAGLLKNTGFLIRRSYYNNFFRRISIEAEKS